MKPIFENFNKSITGKVRSENQDSLFKQGYKENKDGTFSPQPLSEMYPFLDFSIANTNNWCLKNKLFAFKSSVLFELNKT